MAIQLTKSDSECRQHENHDNRTDPILLKNDWHYQIYLLFGSLNQTAAINFKSEKEQKDIYNY